MNEKYKKGKIYVIKYNNEIKYVGSTTLSLNDRFGYFRRNSFNESYKGYNLKVHKYIRETNDWNNWSIHLFLDYPCNNKKELCKKEGEIIKELNPSLNIEIAGRTQEERYNENPEYYKEMWNKASKKWRENNKEYMAILQNKWWHKNKKEISAKRNEKITCECGCKISKKGLSEHRKTQKHLSLLKLEEYGNTN